MQVDYRFQMIKMKAIYALLPLLLLGACAHTDQQPLEHALQKIEMDLDQLDKDGLRGPPNGKVAVAYEFAIPNNAAYKSEVRSIDPTVQFMPGSRGRIQAQEDQCLCIGSTHQPNYLEVLRTLNELPYIDRIIECHFE